MAQFSTMAAALQYAKGASSAAASRCANVREDYDEVVDAIQGEMSGGTSGNTVAYYNTWITETDQLCDQNAKKTVTPAPSPLQTAGGSTPAWVWLAGGVAAAYYLGFFGKR